MAGGGQQGVLGSPFDFMDVLIKVPPLVKKEEKRGEKSSI